MRPDVRNVHEHSALDYRIPYEALGSQLPNLDDHIRLPMPYLLDKVAVSFGCSGIT